MSFVRAYGEYPARLWVEAIDELTDDECRKALTTLRRRGNKYPCNLGEFVEICGKGTAHGPRYLGTPIDPARALPPPKANRDHVDACLASMRSRLPARPQPDEVELEAEPPPLDTPVGEPRGCTCATGNAPCDVCRDWDRRMREL